jgi:hypothetical protein
LNIQRQRSALKLSRSFLADKQDSIPHWAAHASLERIRGRQIEARKIYETVLAVSYQQTIVPGVGQMWCDWAEMEWLAGNDQAALEVILRSAGIGRRADGVAILRAKRALEEFSRQDGMVWRDKQAWIELRSLMEVLMSNDLNTMLEVFDRCLASEDLTAGSQMHESLLTACLIMIYRYGVVLKNAFRPALLRDRVRVGLEQYPDNPLIFGLFLEVERGQWMWGYKRRVLGADSNREKGILRKALEVWAGTRERGMWETQIEIRTTLREAVEMDRTKGSAILWRLFLELEIRAGQFERAKKILFRAIRECPLNKGRF